MNIEYRALERLIHRICNPRTHNDAQVVQIAASIVEFGWTYPLPVDGDNGAIA